MKIFFTLFVISFTLTGFGQQKGSHSELLFPDLQGQNEYAEENASLDRELIQLYDSIIDWSSTDGVLHYSRKTSDYQYVNQHMTRSTSYIWSEGYWVSMNYSGWEYDENYLLVKSAVYGNYDTSQMTKYTYDGNGHQILMVKWEDRGDDTLRIVEKVEQVFNNDLLLQKTTYQEYSSDDIRRTRYSYAYYDDNTVKWMIIAEGDGISWVNTTRNEYTYSPDQDSTITLSWLDGTWQITRRNVRTYSPSGKTTSYLTEKYLGGTYVNSSWFLWTYDENDGLIYRAIRDWRDGAWVDIYHQNCINDNRGNMVYSQEEYLDGTEWITDWLMWETHDANNFLTGHSDHMIGPTPPLIDSTHYNFQTVVGKPEPRSVSVKIYPNPVSSDFTIEIPERATAIEIYTISGNLVRTLTNSARIHNIADLPKGIYLLRVETANGILNQKVMKL